MVDGRVLMRWEGIKKGAKQVGREVIRGQGVVTATLTGGDGRVRVRA